MLGRPVLNGHDIRRANVPAGTSIPPAHHLVYFTPDDLEGYLGADGSDRTFNAPAPFTRRMWGGGRMKFDKHNPLRIGEEAEEHTKLISAVAKTSKSAGEMVLVEVEKKIYGSQGLALVDRRSWVFRPMLHSNSLEGVALRSIEGNILAPSAVSDVISDSNAFPIRKLSWSPVGLFRFSALTFNGHKIHYNEDWTRTAEGHPGVVVHGPLNVINLLDYWRDVHGEGTGPDEIRYRAMSPVYGGEEYQIRTLEILEATDRQSAVIAHEATEISHFTWLSDARLTQSIPRGIVARTPVEARDAVKSLGKSCTLQAQVLWGHLDNLFFENGLIGGSQTVQNPEQGMDIATRMLKHQVVVTENIGHRSLTVNRVLVTESTAYQEQWYLAITIDRENYCPVVIISKHGGNTGTGEMLIRKDPNQVASFTFGFSQGITGDLITQISKFLGVEAEKTNLDDILTKMYRIFRSKDATLLEINSLARSKNGGFICFDAKLVLDDDAAKRQPDIFLLRDTSQEVDDELRAEKHNLVYIKMDGNIGNIVNGAGLAMATNDAIGLHGGASANFLDAGGQATKETMIQALGIVLGDERVKAILINIYGGITRCDMIAESIIGAAQEMTLSVPLVVRLQGTNSTEGLKLLADARLGLHVESDFGRAAQRAVELARLWRRTDGM
ncbi:beta subunit of gdp-forming succinate- ligase [Trichoderma arundinaceum]|uniref:Beta subunit of gdp-forming succinate-ligase n=1 Tax=Trichoderma arundinaceum TaxID=490622 RepID=A0A395NUB0_TRIAR|nr:beta subunit of gdp-forming succinate- ligase [Trichoderma arundinaceum]